MQIFFDKQIAFEFHPETKAIGCGMTENNSLAIDISNPITGQAARVQLTRIETRALCSFVALWLKMHPEDAEPMEKGDPAPDEHDEDLDSEHDDDDTDEDEDDDEGDEW